MDTLCTNSNISKIDLLKLDVQGYELEILKGAKDILKRTSLIITEVSLIEVYKDCPLVSKIVEYFDGHPLGIIMANKNMSLESTQKGINTFLEKTLTF